MNLSCRVSIQEGRRGYSLEEKGKLKRRAVEGGVRSNGKERTH